MNGGSATLSYQRTPSFGFVGEFLGVTNGNVNSSGHDLTLLSYLVGPRYRFVSHQSRWVPFGQILVGGSHANGSLYTATGTPSGSSNGFATTIGGGVDMAITPHLALRAVQADYFLTLLSNGTNNRQNNLRLSTGLVFRFGSR
jgi:peptidoglycan-associated lipoprotein